MRKDIASITRKILQEEPYSRENDGYLIRRVIEIVEPNLYRQDFKSIMDNIQFKGISFESITRTRRRFLEEHPELKVESSEFARKQEEAFYYEQNKHIPRID